MKKRLVLLSTFAVLLLVAAGWAPAVADEGKDEARGKEQRRQAVQDRDDRSYFHQHGYAHLGIPEGHLPPPGECRIWYPGKPPGHQPPPGKCGSLSHRVPAGAWLIQRPEDNPAYVDVAVYDTYQPGMITTSGIFEVNTGAFMRIRPR